MQKIILIIACLCGALVSTAQPNITRAEYFINTDPGFGKAQPILITSPAPNVTTTFGASLTGISEGINSLYIRSMDANGKWSVTNRFLFIKTNVPTVAANINRVEYFINTDPGFGNGTPIPITASPDIKDATGSIRLTGAPEGINSLYIRSRDVNGKWSVTNRFLFVHSLTPTTNKITRAEYFIDTDPGFGKALPITVVAAPNIPDVSFNADIDSLSAGVHALYIRSVDSTGKWSVTNRFLFLKAELPPRPNVTSAEYFIDTDPGFGKAVPIVIRPATDIANFVMNVNITGLSVGTHQLYLRSRDSTGKWSITNIYGFPIVTATAAPLIVINSLNQKTLCGSNQFSLAYHSTGTYNNGNIFSVQLSDAAGSFTTAKVIGTLAGTVSGLVNCTIPPDITNGLGYRVRVVSSSPVVTGVTSDSVFNLYAQPRFKDTTVVIVCSGATTNLNNVFTTTGFTATWNTPNLVTAPLGNYRLITVNPVASFCRDTTQVAVQHEVATWIGRISNRWDNAANWSTGKVPGAKTHVIVTGTTTFPCVISIADANAASVRLLNGANLQTTNNRKLTITEKCALPLPE